MFLASLWCAVVRGPPESILRDLQVYQEKMAYLQCTFLKHCVNIHVTQGCVS